MAGLVGSRLGPYEVLSPLGAGGMGEVYRARDTRLGRDVAIKIVPDHRADDAAALARFEREARAVAALSHPNIVALYDVGRDGTTAFAVMELLEGEPLDRYLARERLTWTRAVEVAAAAADGLAAAHARGFVHRDIKPANIFVTTDGLVKILDFGLAKQDQFQTVGAAAGTTEPGTLLGTVGYIAPEQLEGQPADARSDIFSLGCVLYEMLARRPPFQGETPAGTMAAVLRDDPPALDAVPGSLQAVLRRCLEKQPDRRFQSARDLAFALREIGSAASSEPPRPGRRSIVWQALVAATAAAVLMAGWVAFHADTANTPPASPQVRSIAVLPLVNLSADSADEYFADATTAELTTALAGMAAWRVTARNSAMTYRGTQKNALEIAKELGVDALIDGSVSRSGSRMKIAVQLTDARTGTRLWSDSLDRHVEGILGASADIARAIAQEVNVSLTPDATARLAGRSRTVLPPAYDAYVRARHALEKRTESDLHDAIRLFQQSIDGDATYAPAYVGLADSYAQLGYGSYVAPEEAFPRARAAARKALTLDPDLAEAHASLGYALMYYDWNFPEAEREYKRAIALNPSDPAAHEWYAYWLTAMERPLDDAEREISAAQTLDPLSVPVYADRAYILHYYGRNQDAIRSVQSALDMNPRYPLGYFWLGRIYASEARYAEAEAAFQKIGPLRTWTPAMAALGFAYAKAGRPDAARQILGEFDDIARSGRYASSYAVGVIYAGLGDTERAFACLDAALRERSHWLVWLKRDPRWNQMRADPRFRELVRKVGLPPS